MAENAIFVTLRIEVENYGIILKKKSQKWGDVDVEWRQSAAFQIRTQISGRKNSCMEKVNLTKAIESPNGQEFHKD